MSALKETITDIQEEDVVYVSFKNDYYEVPFYIIMDHQTKSYIVAIRGTFSGNDIITDLTAWPVLMNTPGMPETYTVRQYTLNLDIIHIHFTLLFGIISISILIQELH